MEFDRFSTGFIGFAPGHRGPQRPEEILSNDLIKRFVLVVWVLGLLSCYCDSNIFIPALHSFDLPKKEKIMSPSRLFLMLAIVSLAAIPFLARPVAADTNTGTTGQPNQSCQSVFPTGPLSPARFNTNGFSVADTQYACN